MKDFFNQLFQENFNPVIVTVVGTAIILLAVIIRKLDYKIHSNKSYCKIYVQNTKNEI
jgi:hypothetical protein